MVTGISAIASAGNHTLALGAGGRVYTWGSNANGEAGIGSTQAFFNQAQLLPAPVNVFQVVAGENHCAALDLSTRVWGWEDNTYGQLGDGTSGVARRQPVQTVGIPANAARNLSASAHSGLVILVDGRSMVWGSNANGNRFGTSGVLAVNPIVNSNSQIGLRYYFYGSSTQEVFPSSTSLYGYTKFSGSGNPAFACTNYPNGINARSTTPQPPVIRVESLREAQDSLRLTNIPAQRRTMLLSTVTAATEQRTDYVGLENYLKTLPDPTSPAHEALAKWLLWVYQASMQPAGAARARANLLRHHGNEEEVRRLVQLGEVLDHLRALAQGQRPAETDLRSLQEVAASGTSAAFRACHTLRHYMPACACRLPEGGKATGEKTLATNRITDTPLLDIPYPNPASGECRVRYTLPGAGPAQLELRDGLGRLVGRQVLPAGSGEARLAVGALADGLCTCALVVGGQVRAVRRVAVAH